MSDELFTTRMRVATRKAHKISDGLVNAKLLFALGNNSIWGDGLLVFYEIFKFLENAMKEKKDENLGKLYMPEMNRTAAFEDDLNYYLGSEWKKNYKMRPSVENYLKHLKNLLETDSDLLMAYVYHLYMGLLSGGQILRKTRQIKLIKSEGSNLGDAVTDFSGKKICDLKSELKEKMNLIAKGLDENKKDLLVEESVKVFELNNSIIKSVEGAGKVLLQNNFIYMYCFIIFVAIIYYYSIIYINDH